MSIGIPGFSTVPGGGSPLGSPLRPRSEPRLEPDPDSGPAQVAQAPSAGGAAEVPAGTDPELWAVLTTEERAHFTRLRSMGPLTYSTTSDAASQSSNQARRGVRLDVRV